MYKVDNYVKELSPFYEEIIALITSLDESVEQFNVSEIGFFVASVATLKLLSQKNENLVDEFNSMWLDYICKYYEKELGKKIEKRTLVFELQKKYPIYSKLFLDIFDKKNNEKVHNASVQLIWELFTNTTGKKAPDSFLNLELNSGHVLKSALGIFGKIIEHEESE